MNRIVEKWMYRSRWLFAPVYIGLSLGLLALTIKFFPVNVRDLTQYICLI